MSPQIVTGDLTLVTLASSLNISLALTQINFNTFSHNTFNSASERILPYNNDSMYLSKLPISIEVILGGIVYQSIIKKVINLLYRNKIKKK